MRRIVTIAGCGLAAALLAVASRADPHIRVPRLVADFGAIHVRILEHEMRADLHRLDAFAGKRRVDRFESAPVEKPVPWRIYGRLGPLNFQKELEAYRGDGMRLGLRRSGPRLSGRIYVGVHRTFH
jgi:hypothetical protein